MRRFQRAVPGGAAEGRYERWLRSARLASSRDTALPNGAVGRQVIHDEPRRVSRLEPAARQSPRRNCTNPIPARPSAARYPSTCWRRDTAPRRRANLGMAQVETHQGCQSRARDCGSERSHDPHERQRATRRWTDRQRANPLDDIRNDARGASSNPGCCGAASARERADWQPVKTSRLVLK